MRLTLFLSGFMLASTFVGNTAVAQSSEVLARVRQATEFCRLSVTAADTDRSDVWRRATEAGFIQSASDQPRHWEGDGMTVQVAPGVLQGVPACHVLVRGTGLRPTAIVSVVGEWARGVGFAAVPNARLPISMQSSDLYLDGRTSQDQILMEIGWRD